MGFGGGKKPKDPEKPLPLPTPPTMADPSALAAGNNARSMIGGLQSTIATSSQGDLKPVNTGFKTLLGA